MDIKDDDNVIRLPVRPHARRRAEQSQAPCDEMSRGRFPVDIHGNISFGRLMLGLSTVGLTVRLDERHGRVVISDEGEA